MGAALLRLASGKRTVVVSVGHRVSLSTAVVLTASLCKTSIPEPIRQADLRSRKAVRAWFEGTRLMKLTGAGDLLQVVMPTLGSLCNISINNKQDCNFFTNQAGNESACKSSLAESDVCNFKGKVSKRDAKTSKAKLVWRVKAVPNYTVDDGL